MNQNKKQRRSRFEADGFELWGGYMNAKITKLEEQFEEESKNLKESERLSNIFEGVAIFVNGYTEPSSEDLRLLMLLHGGTYHHYYRSEKTTHMIASNLPNAKIDQLKSIKVVKPEWIVKSIEAKRLLDYKNFLLFSKPSKFQSELKFEASADNPSTSNEKSVFKPMYPVAKTAADPEFLAEFYSNSRLHHISTMGVTFKEYVATLKEKHDGEFPGVNRIRGWFEKGNGSKLEEDAVDKVVMHIDMDCFFVSVALRNHPELIGKPVAVTHARGNPTHLRPGVDGKFEYQFYKRKMKAKLGDSSESESDDEKYDSWFKEPNSRSEVASCSYEARKAGVSNGMYLGSALKVCPDLKTVPYDFEGYKEVSYTLYNTVVEYTLDVEAVSCDELYIDCTSLIRNERIKPLDFATLLRRDIRERTRCPSSIGIGSNKLQARLATKRAKPDGQYCVTSSDLLNFMSGIDVYDLPGVGRTFGVRLKALGAENCLDLRNIPLGTLQKEFGGKNGETLYKQCRGIDDRVVNSAYQRKSVSAEVNYGIRFTNNSEAEAFLNQLSSEVANRLKQSNLKGKNVTLKIMIRAQDAPTEAAKFMGHGACDYKTRTSRFPVPVDDAENISRHVLSMYYEMKLEPSELRGIGIQVTRLQSQKTTGAMDNFLKKKRESSEVKRLREEILNLGTEERKSRDGRKTSNRQRGTEPVEGRLKLPQLSQVDRNVVDSLPMELRLEILNQYGISNFDKMRKSNVPTGSDALSMSQIDPEVLQELPPKLRDEVIDTVANSKNPLKRLSMIEMRAMITEWVTAEPEPEEFDVGLLSNYLCDLVHRKRLEDLDTLLKCLHRNIFINRKNDDEWRSCYRNIIHQMQCAMREVFGKELVVSDL